MFWRSTSIRITRFLSRKLKATLRKKVWTLHYKTFMKKSCCVCLNEVDELADSVHACEICKDTHVCAVCFDVMRQTNIHGKCPVCRCENWSSGSNEVLIITDVNPFTDLHDHEGQRVSVSINILLNGAGAGAAGQGEDTHHDGCHWKLCVYLVSKGVSTLVVVWSIGFIVLSLVYDDFPRRNLFYVIFCSFCVGLFISFLGVQLRMLIAIIQRG